MLLVSLSTNCSSDELHLQRQRLIKKIIQLISTSESWMHPFHGQPRPIKGKEPAMNVILSRQNICVHAGLSIGSQKIWFESYSNEIEHIDSVAWQMEWMISRNIVGSNRSSGAMYSYKQFEWVLSFIKQHWDPRGALQPPIEPQVDYPGDTQNFELFDDELLQAPECTREEFDRFDRFWSSRSINVLSATELMPLKNSDFLLSKHRMLSSFLDSHCVPNNQAISRISSGDLASSFLPMADQIGIKRFRTIEQTDEISSKEVTH